MSQALERDKENDSGKGAARLILEEFALTGSTESFSELYTILFPRLLRYFAARRIQPMIAEELTQNVMLIVYQKLSQLNDRNSFYGWLYKIASNELAERFRKEKRRQELVEFEPLIDEHANLPDKSADTPFSFKFHEWIAVLSEEERELVILRFVDGLSYEELAVAIQIPLGTVKWRISNARKKLAAALNVVD